MKPFGNGTLLKLLRRERRIRNQAEKQIAANRETLVGSVERVTFHNADSGFVVLKVKARGRRDLVPIVGHAGQAL